MTTPHESDEGRLAQIRARAERCARLIRGGRPVDVHVMAAEDIPYLLKRVAVREWGKQPDGGAGALAESLRMAAEARRQELRVEAVEAEVSALQERVRVLEVALERASDGIDLAADWMTSEANRQRSDWAMKRVTSSEIGMRSGSDTLRERAAEARAALTPTEEGDAGNG